MQLSHLNSLRALEATLRHGSFTAAAEELGVTPAAVGQRVRALEDFIGRGLFERTRWGIEPLEDARSVEAQLTTAFAAIARALEQLKAARADNRLAVTLPAAFAEHWFTPLISEFYQRHAEVDLRLDASNRDVDLLSEDFDFAIRYGKDVHAPLQEVVLFEDYVLPVCSPGFAERYDLRPTQRSLEGVPLIHVLNRTGDPGWVGFDGWGKAFGFDPAYLGHGVSYSKVSSGLQSAISGLGLVLCGLTEAYNALRRGDLVLPFGSQLKCETHYKYRLLWVGERRMTGLQKDFMAWVLEESEKFTRARAAYLSSPAA